MHRIDEAGNVGNRFDKGNPAIGQRATVLGADWPNAVQEAICRVIEHAGIALEKGDDEQLYLAIVQIAAGAAGEEDDAGSVPTTRVVGTAGLATGGGALAGNLLITVARASAAETAARAIDTKAITPDGLGDAMAIGMPSGCTRLAGGWIIMTGAASASANATTVVTLPTSFPGACLWAGCEGGTLSFDANENNPFVSGRGTGSISIFNERDSTVPITWFAIGR